MIYKIKTELINNPFRNQDLTDNSFFKKEIFQYFSSETSTKIKSLGLQLHSCQELLLNCSEQYSKAIG